jgi:uncharacterized protein (TIGR03435 family)
MLATILLTALAPAAFAQGDSVNPKALTFEAATIKPTKATNSGWNLNSIPDGYTAKNVSLLKLVGEAYGIFDPKLLSGGPSWMDSDKFDLEAKFDLSQIPDAKSLTYRQRADMLQTLLADRFNLKVHHETKQFPVFNLVISKGGPKFQQTKPEKVDSYGVGITCHHHAGAAEGCSMANLADTLSYPSGRTVIDKTGLKGLYDYTLSGPSAYQAASPDSSTPSIFTTLEEQLGLKLEPSTAPLDVLVIDSAEKPTQN